MITKKQKEQWVEALRSGGYSQGAQRLRNLSLMGEDTFCCLGVLCDVLDPDGWTEFRKIAATHTYSRVQVDGAKSAGTLSEDLIPHDVQAELIGLNDSTYYSFTSIADWIEKHVEVAEE